MTYTTIFEKLLCLFNMISTSWVYIAFSSISILLVALLVFKKISKKVCVTLMLFLTKLVLGYTIYIYYEDVNNLINLIVDNIFLNIYFPSFYVYLFILILINIVGIYSLLKPKLEKSYKIINTTCLIISNFILALILEVISVNNIEIFKKESIFTNTNLVTLLELSVNIFIIWLISLASMFLINVITERIILRKESKTLEYASANLMPKEIIVSNNSIEEEYNTSYSNPLKPVSNIIETSYKFLPDFKIDIKAIEEGAPNTNINSTIINNNYNNTFDLSAFIPKKQEVKPINIQEENNSVFEQILNNQLPLVKEETKNIKEAVVATEAMNEIPAPIENKINSLKDTYTLNDYRIFNKMLKDIREHNASNSIIIDKNLEYRLITKYSSETYDMFKTMLKIYSN